MAGWVMETFLSVVCDNTVGRSDFLGEHGWSCLIERGSERYLFDTGQGLTISYNLKSLEKSLENVKKNIAKCNKNIRQKGKLKN